MCNVWTTAIGLRYLCLSRSRGNRPQVFVIFYQSAQRRVYRISLSDFGSYRRKFQSATEECDVVLQGSHCETYRQYRSVASHSTPQSHSQTIIERVTIELIIHYREMRV